MTKVLAIAAAVLAGAALAVSIAAFTGGHSGKDTQARAEAARLQRSLDAVRAQMAREQSVDVGRVAARVKRILTCLPEIQSEIDGLSPQVSGSSVYLSNTQQMSAYCSPLFYGHSNGD